MIDRYERIPSSSWSDIRDLENFSSYSRKWLPQSDLQRFVIFSCLINPQCRWKSQATERLGDIVVFGVFFVARSLSCSTWLIPISTWCVFVSRLIEPRSSSSHLQHCLARLPITIPPLVPTLMSYRWYVTVVFLECLYWGVSTKRSEDIVDVELVRCTNDIVFKQDNENERRKKMKERKQANA